MKLSQLLTTISLTALLSATAWPVFATANTFFETRDLVPYSGIGSNTGATEVPFGGCLVTGHPCYDTADDNYHNIMWMIGDLNVKQGVYYLPLSDTNAHGKLKLGYTYKLTSEDTHANSTDFGRIRIKNVDTDEILYEKVLVPADAADWQSENITLPGADATKNLQLVFESNNDDSGLTLLYIRNWRLEHKSEPQITGNITYQVNGETRYAVNAAVTLQNKAGTETIATTTTDAHGDYTFFPVTSNKRYAVTSTLDNYNGLVKITSKVKYGHTYNGDFQLTSISS